MLLKFFYNSVRKDRVHYFFLGSLTRAGSCDWVNFFLNFVIYVNFAFYLHNILTFILITNDSGFFPMSKIDTA